MNEEIKLWGSFAGIGILAAIIVLLILFSWSALNAKYGVWKNSLAGQAELARADYNRQITVREAQAKMDAAKLLAQAEVERAKGVAQANKIIGDSLKDNEAYLRYLWVDSLKETKDQVIYVPTESNLPILESGRLRIHPMDRLSSSQIKS